MTMPTSDGGRSKTKKVFADQLLISGSNFLMSLLLARFLGPEGYGQYVLAYGLILFVSGLQVATVISPMMVIGPRKQGNEASAYYSTLLVQQMLFCVLTALLLFGVGGSLAPYFPEWRLDILLVPLVVAACLFLAQDFLRRYFIVRDRAGTALGNDLVTYGIRTGLILAFGLTIGFSAGAALWIIAAGSSIAIVLATWQYARSNEWRWPERRIVSATARSHWQLGKWLLGTSIAYWMGSQLVIYMTAGLVSAEAVGAMSAALNIVGITNVLFLTMENLVPARASRIHAARGIDGLNRYMRRVLFLSSIAAAAIVSVAAIWSEFWLNLLYGPAYAGYGWIVLWWGLYYLIGLLHRLISIGLRVVGYTKGIFLANLAGSITALVIGYPAIKLAGINGSLAALCVVQLAILVVQLRNYAKALARANGEQHEKPRVLETGG